MHCGFVDFPVPVQQEPTWGENQSSRFVRILKAFGVVQQFCKRLTGLIDWVPSLVCTLTHQKLPRKRVRGVVQHVDFKETTVLLVSLHKYPISKCSQTFLPLIISEYLHVVLQVSCLSDTPHMNALYLLLCNAQTILTSSVVMHHFYGHFATKCGSRLMFNLDSVLLILSKIAAQVLSQTTYVIPLSFWIAGHDWIHCSYLNNSAD